MRTYPILRNSIFHSNCYAIIAFVMINQTAMLKHFLYGPQTLRSHGRYTYVIILYKQNSNFIKYTHWKEFEERVLEDFPLLVLISNERKVNFAQILGEEKDQANSSVERWQDIIIGNIVAHMHRFIKLQILNL